MNVYVLGDTWMQFNGGYAIDIVLLYISSYSQLGCVVHFLWNLLTQNIVILLSLHVGTAKVVIDILFTALHHSLPIHNEQDIQEHVVAECKGHWHAA